MKEKFDKKNVVGLFSEDEDESLGNCVLDIDVPKSIIVNPPKSLDDLNRTINSIEDVTQLMNDIASFRPKGFNFLFRGHGDESFQLQPTIVRGKIVDYQQEKELYKSLKIVCDRLGYDKFRLKDSNEILFYLGIGRHLGFSTRLLDWSASIWNALSFLMEEKYLNKDGELLILAYDTNKITAKNRDPFLVHEDIAILKDDYLLPDDSNFPLGVYRRFRQNGFFTVQSETKLGTPFEKTLHDGMYLIRVGVPKETKKEWAKYRELFLLDWLYVGNDKEAVAEIKSLNEKYVKKKNCMSIGFDFE